MPRPRVILGACLTLFTLSCGLSGGAEKPSRPVPTLHEGDAPADYYSRRVDVLGTVGYGDERAFRVPAGGYVGWLFTGRRNAVVSADLRGAGNDPVLHLYGPKRRETWDFSRAIATNDDSSGLDSHVERRLPADGTYLLLAREYWEEGGSMTLSLACAGAECRPECGADDACPLGASCHRIWCVTTPCPSYCEAIDPSTACEHDADCASIPSGCCPCSMGGTNRAVNESYAEALTPSCSDAEPVMCPAVYLCTDEVPRCVGGTCELVPEPGDECSPEDCGPAPLMPSYLCEDGVTVAGPTGVCEPREGGGCGWEIVRCPEAGLCGSRGLPECADGTFCDYDLDAWCGAADAPGRCRAIPTACTRELMPVCGCDGRTYPNWCNANAAGVSVASVGSCLPPG